MIAVLIACALNSAAAQVSPAVQVPLETTTGWGPIKPPAGYLGLRIHGRTTADPFVLTRLFGDFASHRAMFPRVVSGVDILACDASSLRARYRTVFDSRPGGKTTVESLTNVKVSLAADRSEFTWSSDTLTSKYVNAAWGRALFITRRTPNGSETLIDYVTAVRPKNTAKRIMVESQKSVLASDAIYVIDRLMAAAKQHANDIKAVPRTTNVFNCSGTRTRD